MDSMFVTMEVFQLVRGSLNVEAPRKIKDMSVAWDVSQSLIFTPGQPVVLPFASQSSTKLFSADELTMSGHGVVGNVVGRDVGDGLDSG